MNLVIPSYKRASILNSKTLPALREHGIPKEMINIFVVQSQEEEYQKTLDPSLYNILVVGEEGLVPQRNFIERYYPTGSKIVSLDDDIQAINLNGNYPSLLNFFENAFRELEEQNAFIWGVYPVNNSFFYNKAQPITTDLKYIVGAFYGFINRPNDPELEISICKENGNKEDVERSIKYFLKDGKVVRFNHISFKTKYYGKDGGGLGTKEARLEKMKEGALALKSAYPDITSVKIRKNGLYEITFKNPTKKKPKKVVEKKGEEEPPAPYFVGAITEEDCKTVLELLSKISIRINSLGRGRSTTFGTHRAMTLGYIKARVSRVVGLSAYSKKYPDLYNAVVELGKKFCPFEFTSIHVNHNVVCPRHLDANNVGVSCIVSFGDYEGCELVIEPPRGSVGENKTFNTKYNPLVFDGSSQYHFNTPLLSGTKYSLVFFNAPQK
jgi:hypothetical protein